MKVRRAALKDQVTVATRTGGGSYGDTLAAPVTVYCLVDETRRQVRDASGELTVSEATLTLHPRSRVVGSSQTVDPLAVFTEGSEVSLGGRPSEVITAKQLTQRGYVVAVEVTCG